MHKVIFAGALVVVGSSTSLARADVTVAVDPTQDAHAISPLIYGMNFASAAQIAQGKIPLTRWGGNSTTRYNYQNDVRNTGSDYFFENIPGCAGSNPCPPADPKAQSTANVFLGDAKQSGIVALFTVPTIGFTPKDPSPWNHPYLCGCPKNVIPGQDSFDPYDTNCGNGQSGGKAILCPDPTTTTSIAITPQWVHDWVAYIVTKFGPSNGKVIYELDNEPALWSSTHHDVRGNTRLSYDELWQRMHDYAIAILQADPTALIAGFEEWGWPNYFCSDADNVSQGCSATSPDRAAHGGEELTAWILDQAAKYEKANNQRILHFLDLHYYPQGGQPPETTRSLWDATYTDPSWINDKIRLVPRMHDWVTQHYPGTKIGVSEYDWGHHAEALGAVTYAEVLGIFGREGLDYATAWAPPAETETAFAAYKLYANYDGQGAHFQPIGVRATVTGTGVQAFASVSASQVTVALVNETGAAVTTTVTLGNFAPGATAHYYELGNGVAIDKKPDVAVAGSKTTVSVGGTTIGMLVIDGANPNQLPDAGGGPGGPGPGGPGGSDGGLSDGGPGGNGDTGSSGGCGCRVGGAGETGIVFGFGAALALVVGGVARRRRLP